MLVFSQVGEEKIEVGVFVVELPMSIHAVLADSAVHINFRKKALKCFGGGGGGCGCGCE